MDNFMNVLRTGIIVVFILSFTSAWGQIVLPENPRDCRGSILICGNAEIGITPDGPGNNEFAEPGNIEPSCLQFSQFPQAWFRVEIATDGTFQFEINPDDGVADYDFAVFGPTTDCSNLGAAIRCSSTNPQNAGVPAATGLNATSTDTEEGPGELGDGFLRELDVLAGETYYIIVGLAIGSGGFSLNVSGTTTFPQAAFANDVPDIQECDDIDAARDGFKEFDFSSLDNQILNGQTNAVVSYFESLNDANLGRNPISFPYTNTSNPQEIFYSVERTDSQCVDFNQFTVTVDDSRIDRDANQITICSTNATEDFDFLTMIDKLVPNNTLFEITYHNSLADAVSNTNSRVGVFTVTKTLQTAYIKITDPMGQVCDSILKVPLIVANPPTIAMPSDLPVCDDDFDGFVITDLRIQDMQILNGLDPANHAIVYYSNPTDRDAQINGFSSFTNTSTTQPIFALVTNRISGCTAATDFQLIVNPRPVLAPQDARTICLDAIDPLVLSVEAGFSFYQWSSGESGVSTNEIFITAPGDYTVTVTNSTGCQSSLTLVVNPSDLATIDSIQITDFQRGNNSVTINASGPGDYEFAIDDRSFQDSPDFTGLASGFHDFRVRDKNGCGTLRSQFGILDFQPFFTPNFDGYNDYWTLDALSEYPGARLLIYDRYGKLLKQILPNSIGWDGTFNRELLPSTTYWFTVEIPDRPVVRGFFALKR
jgi:gliding motility-associated-like protein